MANGFGADYTTTQFKSVRLEKLANCRGFDDLNVAADGLLRDLISK